MAAHHFDDNDYLWELDESYVDLFPPRRLRSVTDSRSCQSVNSLDEVEFRI